MPIGTSRPPFPQRNAKLTPNIRITDEEMEPFQTPIEEKTKKIGKKFW